MPVKIRLSRQGRKMRPFYYIVVADSRTPRDGRFIERIGSYNPNSNPATIDLEFDKALTWLQNGAQPTDTCRAILSYKGVLYKHHLLKGVKKGAFDEATAEERFEKWLKEKEAKIETKIENLANEKANSEKKRFDAETKVKEAKAQKIAEKNAEVAKAEAKENEPEETAETTEDTTATEVTEVKAETTEETPVAEDKATEETKTETAETEADKEATDKKTNNTIHLSLLINEKDDCIYLGFLIKTHGSKGEILVQSDYQLDEYIEMESVFFLKLTKDWFHFFISNIRQKSNDTFLLQFDDIDSEQKAREFISCKIFILQSVFAKYAKQENNISPRELTGFQVYTTQGVFLGIVKGFHEITSNPLLIIENNELEELIPFQDSYIKEIDIQLKRISCLLPDGFSDIND